MSWGHHSIRRLTAAVIAAVSWPAAADGGREGPYAVLAAGMAVVDHDCGFYFDCERGHASVMRAAVGWRSGTWSLEGWALRLGDASVGDAYVPRTLSLRGWGGVAAWHWALSDRAELQLRLGALSMRHERTDDGVNTDIAPLMGLGWLQRLSPQVQLEVAWDLTRADGNNVSTTLLQLITAGVRVHF